VGRKRFDSACATSGISEAALEKALLTLAADYGMPPTVTIRIERTRDTPEDIAAAMLR
jgi:hypothetical protein